MALKSTPAIGNTLITLWYKALNVADCFARRFPVNTDQKVVLYMGLSAAKFFAMVGGLPVAWQHVGFNALIGPWTLKFHLFI